MPSPRTDVNSTLTCSACAHGNQAHHSFAKHGAPEGLSGLNSDTVESPVHSAGGAEMQVHLLMQKLDTPLSEGSTKGGRGCSVPPGVDSKGPCIKEIRPKVTKQMGPKSVSRAFRQSDMQTRVLYIKKRIPLSITASLNGTIAFFLIEYGPAVFNQIWSLNSRWNVSLMQTTKLIILCIPLLAKYQQPNGSTPHLTSICSRLLASTDMLRML
jgi:hypothetical protein